MQKIGKEVKIGLAVIGVLLTTFGYVLVKRLMRPSEANAATVAGATQPGDSSKSLFGTNDSTDRPTVLSSSSQNRHAIVPVEAKSSRFGDDSSRRRPADGSGGDPASSASDSFMPAQTAAVVADNHPNGPPTHDDHVAAAGYGAGQPGDAASNTPGNYGSAGGNTAPYGAPVPASGGAATDHHHDRSGSTPAVDPFQVRGGMTADNSPAASAPSPQAAQSTLSLSDPNRAPRQLDPNTGSTTAAAAPMRTADQPGYGTPVPPPDVVDSSNSTRGPMPSERRAADRGTPAANGAVTGYSYGGRSDSSGDSPYRSGGSDPGIVGNVTTDPNRDGAMPAGAPRNEIREHSSEAAPNYSPGAAASPPFAVQRSADPPAAPQTLALDGSARKAGQYVVQPNDNYWTISEKVYGSGAYFKAIFEYNRNRHPQADRLQVGEALDTPDATLLQRTYPDLCPKATRAAATGRVVPASARMLPGTRVYTVEEGDTLFEIARRELGKPSRWGEIYQLNRDTVGGDFDYLRPGTELLLPADGGVAGSQSLPVARDPSGTMLR